MDRLTGYLIRSGQDLKIALFFRLSAAWALSYRPHLLLLLRPNYLVDEILSLQGADGGWSMNRLGPGWSKRSGTGQTQDVESDGAATAFAVIVLNSLKPQLKESARQIQDSIARGRNWLEKSQLSDGGWPNASLNFDRPRNHHYSRNMATAFAVRALFHQFDDESRDLR